MGVGKQYRGLGELLSWLEENHFRSEGISPSARKYFSCLLAERSQKKRGFKGCFPAPTDRDLGTLTIPLTREPLRSGHALPHLLGEEACRALRHLDSGLRSVSRVLETVDREMEKDLQQDWKPGREGIFCCGTCTVAVWRHMLAGGFQKFAEEGWLEEGLKTLRKRRTRQGGWRGFPFIYTLSALWMMPQGSALAEIFHSKPVWSQWDKLSLPEENRDFRVWLREALMRRCEESSSSGFFLKTHEME